LEHDSHPPMRCLDQRKIGRASRFTLRQDTLEWPGVVIGKQSVIEGPASVMVVPFYEDGSTALVRQWRNAWGGTAWEVCAGSLEEGEEPQESAPRELAEEVGLTASIWSSLGQVRPHATFTGIVYLFLARQLTEVEPHLEPYEQDLILQRLPLSAAVELALNGEIEHSGSCVALLRAARVVGVI
ncbi:MAG: NUDIX domain-containing protein, partial [Candidatus Dormibacteraceae bacterium]